MPEDPLHQLGKQVGSGLNVPNIGTAPVLQIDPLAKSFLQQGAMPIEAHTASKLPFKEFDPKYIGTGVGHAYNGYGFYLSKSKSYTTSLRDEYHPGGVVQTSKINAKDSELFNLDAAKVPAATATQIEQFSGQPLPRFSTARDALYHLENIPVPLYRQKLNDPTISTSQQGASKFLNSLGFKGNKYTDSYGTHYVIYSPEDLQVQQP